MQKQDIELIVYRILANEEEALHMKVYKNGTICRSGMGGVPALKLGFMTETGNSELFDHLLAMVPQAFLNDPINAEEPQTPNGSLEYMLAFYGDSKNGEHGENADWGQASGIRYKIDQRSQTVDNLLILLDKLAGQATFLTNELYLDAYLLSVWEAKGSTLPNQTIINQPNTKKEVFHDYKNFLSFLSDPNLYAKHSWLLKNKFYLIKDKKYKLIINNLLATMDIGFKPVEEELFKSLHVNPDLLAKANQNIQESPSPKKKKPWWKF